MGLLDPLARLIGVDPDAHARLQHERDALVVTLEAERQALRDVRAELASQRARSRDALAVQTAFLSRMSHELRTPLNAIQGYVELLLDEAQPDTAADLRKIRLSALNLTALVTSILDLTELQTGDYHVDPTWVPIDVLIREVVENVRITSEGQGNTVAVDVEANLVAVLDRRMLHSMLFNLLSNANKYTKGGKVTVRAHRVCHGDGHRVEIVVADTGIGMTPRQLQEAYRPFRQADESFTRRYDGSGVGLAVVRGFAEAMSGTVAIASEPGKGAVVTLLLPMSIDRGDDDDSGHDEPTRIHR